MSTSRRQRRLLTVFAWLAAVHVLLAYGLPEWLFIVLLIGLGVMYWRVGAAGAVLTSVMLLVVTVFYGLALHVTGFEDRIYYRPDEKYLRFDYVDNHRIYKPNVHVEMTMPHGDLRAMTAADIAEPHPLVFQTDRDGFRNSRDYHGQRWLLVGDSFVTGHSNSQEDLLVSQLERDYAIDAYSLGNTGNLADYAAYLRGFERRYGPNHRALVFLFEGNDFDESRARNPSALARYGRRYYSLFSDFNTYRVTMSLWKRATRSHAIQAGSALELAELAGRPAAFYKPYTEVTRRARLTEVENFEPTLAGIAPQIERVYFVPTSYRVYHRQLKPGETLPNAQWDYLAGLCSKYRLHCTNLTEPLVRESQALLRQGKLIWWRDDTHWNRAGIAVAARVVAADLKAAERSGR